jgi:hypothetical protein
MLHALTSSPVLHLIEQQSLDASQKFETLQRLIEKYGQSQCSNMRDRIYSLLSLASDCTDGQGLTANYSLDPSTLYSWVLSFYQPSNETNFSNVLQDVLSPDQRQLDRLKDLQDLSDRYGNSDSQQLRMAIREMLSHTACYEASEEHRTKYNCLKAVVAWKIVALDHPFEPSQFCSIFERKFGADKASESQIYWSELLQRLLDKEVPLSLRTAVIELIYPAIELLASKYAAVFSGPTHNLGRPAVSTFWAVLSSQRFCRFEEPRMLGFGRTLQDILEV